MRKAAPCAAGEALFPAAGRQQANILSSVPHFPSVLPTYGHLRALTHN